MDAKRCHAETSAMASAEIIAGNIDLLMEIIVRLPVKLLVRFQLVSKDWRSIISYPTFCRRHTRIHGSSPLRTGPPCLILGHAWGQKFFWLNPRTRHCLPYRFNFPYAFTKILQSCNGLMLLECKSSPFGQKVYIVHNPTTWESREVPIEYVGRKKPFRLVGLCLAYDPAKSPNYRVVCIKSKRPNFWLEIYDPETRNWTEIKQTFFSSDFQLTFWNGIYSNNLLYWLRPTSNSLYYDLDSGKLGRPPRIRGPSRKEGHTTRCHVLESKGHLYCIFLYMHYKEHQRKYFVVFELQEDKGGWTKYRVDVCGPSHALWDIVGAITPLAIVRGEVEGDFTILFYVDWKLISYRMTAGVYDVVVEIRTAEETVVPMDMVGMPRMISFQLVESLVPV